MRDEDVRRVGVILFSCEALVHGLTLFEPAEGVRYFYRSALVLYVLLMVYGARLSRALPTATRSA